MNRVNRGRVFRSRGERGRRVNEKPVPRSRVEELSKSLCWMTSLQNRRLRSNFDSIRPVILIDEVSRPLLYAARFGFHDEIEGIP